MLLSRKLLDGLSAALFGVVLGKFLKPLRAWNLASAQLQAFAAYCFANDFKSTEIF
jgi:hypothetical protein